MSCNTQNLFLGSTLTLFVILDVQVTLVARFYLNFHRLALLCRETPGYLKLEILGRAEVLLLDSEIVRYIRIHHQSPIGAWDQIDVGSLYSNLLKIVRHVVVPGCRVLGY
jgi:hypothetical protein